MAYAFNDDKSKVEVNDLFKVVAVTSVGGSSVEPNKETSPYRFFNPPEGYSVVGIVGLETSSRSWNIMKFFLDNSGGSNLLMCVLQNVSGKTQSVLVTFHVLLVKTDFIDK